jgi:Fe-S cluster assembly protein SufD
MPSTRNEDYRFTDVSGLLAATLSAAPGGAAVDAALLEQLALAEAAGSRVVMVNGLFRPELSDLAGLPQGVYVGGSAGAPGDVLQQLVGAQAGTV